MMEEDFGYVQDVCADLGTGVITSIIVPGTTNKVLSIFSQTNDIVIPWQNIKCIGEDLILVDI
jgi:YlmC/YmxH family sporulation protein